MNAGAPEAADGPVASGAPVVSNAGPLLALAKLNLLHLLKTLYGRVHIPRSVYGETVIEGMRAGHEDAHTLYLFLEQTRWPIYEVVPKDIPVDLRTAPLDRGERDALALALALKSDLVLMDETIGRKVARALGLAVRGSLRVLIQAHEQHLIDADQLRLYLAEMVRRQDIWVSPTLAKRLRFEVLGE